MSGPLHLAGGARESHMRKVGLVFVIAVFVPSLVLAWLAVRSLSDQEFLLQRQQSLLYQGVADAVSTAVQNALADYQHSFTLKVSALVGNQQPQDIVKSFDDQFRKDWPLAQVGFVVTLTGDIPCPSPLGRTEARNFCADNSRFLANRESVEVYWNPKQAYNNTFAANSQQQQRPTEPGELNVDTEKRG